MLLLLHSTAQRSTGKGRGCACCDARGCCWARPYTYCNDDCTPYSAPATSHAYTAGLRITPEQASETTCPCMHASCMRGGWPRQSCVASSAAGSAVHGTTPLNRLITYVDEGVETVNACGQRQAGTYAWAKAKAKALRARHAVPRMRTLSAERPGGPGCSCSYGADAPSACLMLRARSVQHTVALVVQQVSPRPTPPRRHGKPCAKSVPKMHVCMRIGQAALHFGTLTGSPDEQQVIGRTTSTTSDAPGMPDHQMLVSMQYQSSRATGPVQAKQCGPGSLFGISRDQQQLCKVHFPLELGPGR